jgi:hypothetical protein
MTRKANETKMWYLEYFTPPRSSTYIFPDLYGNSNQVAAAYTYQVSYQYFQETIGHNESKE